MLKLQAIRGFNDVLPVESLHWQYLMQKIYQIAEQYGYQEIYLPLLEKTELFARTVGEVTDIVEKEMYTFLDRNSESLSLRPEGTAGCVRAGIEHGLLHNQIQRLWYSGPMFRYEKPQSGRYRQFYQVGFEAFGMSGSFIEAELILLTASLWRFLGLSNKLTLEINSLGDAATRQNYREALIDYFMQFQDQLDFESKQRLHRNPLRILDSKNPELSLLIEQAPKLSDFLNEASKKNFLNLQDLLTQNEISFVINPRLVRGLDYYNDTVFEWVSTQLGAQATVCAGGRYDGLVSQLGGKATPGVGFAMGLERILLLLSINNLLPPYKKPWIYFVSVGLSAKSKMLTISENLRTHFPKAQIIVDNTLSNFSAQMKRADKSEAALALLIGEDEMKTDTITVKFLRDGTPQQTINLNNLVDFLRLYYDVG